MRLRAHRQCGQHHPQCGPAHPRPDTARYLQPTAVDRRFLRDGLRGLTARRRQPGRQVRAQAVLPHRPGRVRSRIHRCRVLRVGGPADRVAGCDGGRCGANDPRLAVDHQRRVPRPSGAGPRHWRLGRDHWAWHRHRPDRRRPAASPILVGLHIPRQRPDRGRRVRRRPAAGTRLQEPGRRPARSLGGGAVDRRPWPAAVGHHRSSRQRLGLLEGNRSRTGQPGRPRHLCDLGGPQQPPDAEAGVLFRSPVLGGRGG